MWQDEPSRRGSLGLHDAGRAVLVQRGHGWAGASRTCSHAAGHSRLHSSPFGPRVLLTQPRAGTYHYGVDLPAPVGASVPAVADGMPIRMRDKGPGGLEMLVQQHGFVGVSSHLKMVNPVFTGGKTDIGQGEMLGLVGITGMTSGPHVYFGMIMAEAPVDPEPYLGVAAYGAVVQHQPAQKTDGLRGTVIGGRKYYQIAFPPEQQPDYRFCNVQATNHEKQRGCAGREREDMRCNRLIKAMPLARSVPSGHAAALTAVVHRGPWAASVMK
jgi:hypothetical protein